MIENKPFYLSKTLWVNGLLLVGGIATALADHLATGGVMSVFAVLNLVLRVVTKTELV